MRTTIDLRPDLHRRAASIAHDRGASLSETVNELLAQVLDPAPSGPTFAVDTATGLPTVTIGRVVTTDDVRSLDDPD